MLNLMNIFDEFPEYTNTLMFLLKILLNKRMLDNSAEGSQANRNSPTDMLDQKDILRCNKNRNVIILASDRRLHECPKCPHLCPQR